MFEQKVGHVIVSQLNNFCLVESFIGYSMTDLDLYIILIYSSIYLDLVYPCRYNWFYKRPQKLLEIF